LFFSGRGPYFCDKAIGFLVGTAKSIQESQVSELVEAIDAHKILRWLNERLVWLGAGGKDEEYEE
jgi:hypothetical protein